MKSDYLAIFEQRGRAYDVAMQTYPFARDAEFRRLFDKVDFSHIHKVLDVPAGGGYLQRHVPAGVSIESLEPCAEFQPQTPHLNSSNDLESLALPAEQYQLIVCLAAIHHVKNKAAFFQQCHRALQSNGLFCIGDIHQQHSITGFLDGFAGLHNGTGHKGYYLSEASVEQLAQQNGFTVVECVQKPCPWQFESLEHLLLFCRLLFGLKTASDEQLQQALGKTVGISEQQGKTLLHWQMLYATLQKKI